MTNRKLAIAIPTYNRAEILKENLLYMMDDIKRYNIPIYISDDSNNNETMEMIQEFKKIYINIFYSKNFPSLGHDQNCFKTLQLPKEKYIWYLGDSIIIEKGSLQKILEIIEDNYDLLITNHRGRNLTINSGAIQDSHYVVKELTWHLTLTGATIYHRDIIDALKNNKAIVYKNFPQTAIILVYLVQNCNIYYCSNIITFSNKNKISYWNNSLLDVFAYDWYNFIMSLPNFYSIEEKKIIIKSHSKNTNIFGKGALVKYKKLGILNIKQYIKYFKYIHSSSHVSNIIILLIVLVPKRILNTILRWKSED